MADFEEADWVRARDASARLVATGMDIVHARASLASHLRDGAIRARADHVWKSTERYMNAAWKSAPPDAGSKLIPVQNWRYEKDIEGDRKRWRWIADRFAVTTRMKPRTRIVMRGIRFLIFDLQKIYPDTFGDQQKRKRGRGEDGAKRNRCWVQILQIISRGEFKKSRFGSIEELAMEIEEGLKSSAGSSTPLLVGKNMITEVARAAHAHLPD